MTVEPLPTRFGPLVAHQPFWAVSMSLNVIASPAAWEPGPFVTPVVADRGDGRLNLLVVRRWTQRSPGSRRTPAAGRGSSVTFPTALGNFAL
jgi:hypothetical protein